MQWSPKEDNVFASCSVDGSIAIWDARKGKKPACSFKAHDADVNVISWNRSINLIVSVFHSHRCLILFQFIILFSNCISYQVGYSDVGIGK